MNNGEELGKRRAYQKQGICYFKKCEESKMEDPLEKSSHTIEMKAGPKTRMILQGQ